jgi:hypothetical protein
MFVDYAGQTVAIIERYTGLIRQAQVFVNGHRKVQSFRSLKNTESVVIEKCRTFRI